MTPLIKKMLFGIESIFGLADSDSYQDAIDTAFEEDSNRLLPVHQPNIHEELDSKSK
ncbi:MAG: hypothetical protein OEY93_02980 [Anaerolineae bacterium]|nr:hypothetical protein [Anaerolineae bacterium]